jgi:hypothetical protein
MMALLFLPRQRCSRGIPFERMRERNKRRHRNKRLRDALRRPTCLVGDDSIDAIRNKILARAVLQRHFKNTRQCGSPLA